MAVFLLTFYRDSCLIFSISLSLIFHLMGLIIYLMRYGTLLHVLYPFFIFPVDSTFVVLLFGFRPEYNEISPHHAGFMKGTTKNENELICPPTRMLAININFIPVSCSARVKSIWETRTNVYCFDLLSQFNLIWIYFKIDPTSLWSGWGKNAFW